MRPNISGDNHQHFSISPLAKYFQMSKDGRAPTRRSPSRMRPPFLLKLSDASSCQNQSPDNPLEALGPDCREIDGVFLWLHAGELGGLPKRL